MGQGTVARHLRVEGRVQGVFFRSSMRERAQQRGVRGWVRNQPDGSVEAWLEGQADAVDAVEQWVRGGGPPAAAVDDLETSQRSPEGFDGFSVRH